ncbi:alanine racemase [Gulosibacter chungangensis]|uniref:alanine racemase n=1 Tax=Gulosibacter chungangensis TaxID=979746 RepID=UPI001787D804|nr:alanine racemase C-terminal domain-containing protein [Gulosibacter chungangensis]
MTAPPRVVRIDMTALEQNLQRLAPEVIDVRADAYGHGLNRVLATARESLPGLRGAIVSEVELASIDRELLHGLEVSHAADPRVASAAVYGLDPNADTVPVMAVRAQVVLRKPLKAGEGVSYGGSYRCETDTSMALVAIGYSQGIARRASNRCYAAVAGSRCPVAGSISMDLLSVDVGALPVDPGDYVELFGNQVRLTEWSAATGIAPLALSSRIQQSVPRIEVRA